MRTGAIIIATGVSQDGQVFDPLTMTGSISAAERIAAVLNQAGIDSKIFITGSNAHKLEKTLTSSGVITLYNPAYKTDDMLASVRFALRYLAGKCDKVIVSPVSAPMFTAKTVSALLEAEDKIVVPTYKGATGHPVAISMDVAEKLLLVKTDAGFEAALGMCGAEIACLPTSDSGVIYSLSADSDSRAMLEYHNSSFLRPVIDVAVARETPFINDKYANLLELVDEFHSVQIACRCIQISYSSAWSILRNMETQAGCQLISRVQGGIGGGRSELTVEGRRLLELYRSYKREVQANAEALYSKYFSDKYVRRAYLVCSGELANAGLHAHFTLEEDIPLSTFGKLQGCLMWKEFSDKAIGTVYYDSGVHCAQTAKLISDKALPLEEKFESTELSDIAPLLRDIITRRNGNSVLVLKRESLNRVLYALFGEDYSLSVPDGSYTTLALDGNFRLAAPPAIPHPELSRILCTRLLNTALVDDFTIRKKIAEADRVMNEAFCSGEETDVIESAVMLRDITLTYPGKDEPSCEWLRRIGYTDTAECIGSLIKKDS